MLTSSRYGTGIRFVQGPRSKCSAPSQGKRFRNRSQGTVIQNQQFRSEIQLFQSIFKTFSIGKFGRLVPKT